MTEPRAERTLVKSPPELWAEISDPEALTRHLSPFGEIRVVGSDPETTVAWEGDRVRGTVELEASGWGTKVTLTAQATPADPGSGPNVEEEAAAPVATPARATAPLPASSRRQGLLGRFRRRPHGAPGPASEPAEAPAVPPSVQKPAPPPGAATAPGPDALAVEAVLVGVLDDLGSAQKRPFSR